MIVLRDIDSLKVYYPRLTIRATLTLTELYGSPTKPLEATIPSFSDLVFILSLCLAEYNLSDDTIYELIDTIDNLLELIMNLYIESGLINNDNQSQVEHEEIKHDEQQSEPIDFKQQIDKLLGQCMDIGMTENDFYNSTFKQVTRYAESHNKYEKAKMQEQAYFDYQLANMIGISVARLFSEQSSFPNIEEVYPLLFNEQESIKDDTVGADGMTAEERAIELNRIKMLEWVEQQNKKRKKQKAKEDNE